MENRGRYDGSAQRCERDLTDAEWSLIAALIPPAKRGGTKWTVPIREVVNALLYVLNTGCQWRALPKDLPARSTVYDCFDRWDYEGILMRIHHAPFVQRREASGRAASPIAAILDSQSVKGAESPLRRMAQVSRSRSGRQKIGAREQGIPSRQRSLGLSRPPRRCRTVTETDSLFGAPCD